MVMRISAIVACVALILTSARPVAFAQQEPVDPAVQAAPTPEPSFPKTYNPIDAARDAQQYAERLRRQAIDRQLGVISDMRWYSALPPGSVWHSPSGVTYARPYPSRRALRRGWNQAFRYPYAGYPGVYAPLPWGGGSVYATPYIAPVPQPLGHKVIETGPNGYIYRPVYDSDLSVAPSPTLAPPEAPKPAVEPVPAPAPEAGPVEF